MSEKGDAAKAVARNLHAAIERVREDVAKVEFWADAVSGFTEPVPEYNSKDVNIWLPQEQAKTLKPGNDVQSNEQSDRTSPNPSDGPKSR